MRKPTYICDVLYFKAFGNISVFFFFICENQDKSLKKATFSGLIFFIFIKNNTLLNFVNKVTKFPLKRDFQKGKFYIKMLAIVEEMKAVAPHKKALLLPIFPQTLLASSSKHRK